MVRVGQVVEHGQVDGENAHGGATDGQRGHDVWHGRRGCPAEPEQADGHEGGFNAREVQSALGCRGQEFPS